MRQDPFGIADRHLTLGQTLSLELMLHNEAGSLELGGIREIEGLSRPVPIPQKSVAGN